MIEDEDIDGFGSSCDPLLSMYQTTHNFDKNQHFEKSLEYNQTDRFCSDFYLISFLLLEDLT
jgi:hypothetical protein